MPRRFYIFGAGILAAVWLGGTALFLQSQGFYLDFDLAVQPVKQAITKPVAVFAVDLFTENLFAKEPLTADLFGKFKLLAQVTTYDLSVAIGSPTGTAGSKVTSSPAGIDCTSNFSFDLAGCRESYASGEVVTLTAVPANANTQFSSWTGTGACAGSSPTCAVTMNVIKSVNANFIYLVGSPPALRVNMSVPPAGVIGTVTSADGGINCNNRALLDPVGCEEIYALNQSVTLTAGTPPPNSAFIGWAGSVPASCTVSPAPTSCALTMNANKLVAANFKAFPKLVISKFGNGSVASSPAGINCGGDCEEYYSLITDTAVTLTATPAAGAAFSKWTVNPSATPGDCNNNANATCTITVPKTAGVVTVTAQFINLQTVTVNKTIIGSGSGTVTSNPVGINCGPTCSFDFFSGTNLKLVAAPDAGGWFRWVSGCDSLSGTNLFNDTCNVSVTGPKIATVEFIKTSLEINMTGVGTGSMTGCSKPTSAEVTCPNTYQDAPTINLVISTPPGSATSAFTEWGGDCASAGTNYTCVINVDGIKSVTANFSPLTVTLVKSGAGRGVITGGGTDPVNCGVDCSSDSANFFYNAVVRYTASPDTAPATFSEFGGWTGECESGTGGANFICDVKFNRAKTITAQFNVAAPKYSVITAINGGSGVLNKIISLPAGIDCGANCGPFAFDYLSDITLNVGSGGGFFLSTWTHPSVGGCDNLDTSAAQPSCLIKDIAANKNITAYFSTTFRPALNVNKAGNGSGAVTGTGINCGVDCWEFLTLNQTYTLTATPDALPSFFLGWSGPCEVGSGGTTNTCNVKMDSHKTITANFATESYPTVLKLNKAGLAQGTVSGTDGTTAIACGENCSQTSQNYFAYSKVLLSATPAADAVFSGWSGGGCETATSTCLVAMLASKNIFAAFNLKEAPADTPEAEQQTSFSLRVELTGGGLVRSIAPDNQISCVSGGVVGCNASYFEDPTPVTLTAASGDDDRPFEGWDLIEGKTIDDSCIGTGDCNLKFSCAAAAEVNTAKLTVIAPNSSQGKITSPSGVDCGQNCSRYFVEGVSVTLAAESFGNYALNSWGGDCGSSPTCVLTMDGDKTVSASFAPFNYTLALSPSSGAVSAGSNISTAATITKTGGAADNLSFSAFGLPAGANYSFNPVNCAPTSGSCSSTLTINTSVSTPVGNYSIGVVASSGTLSKTTFFALAVNPAPFDYSINLPGIGYAINQGATAGMTFHVTKTQGIAQLVSWSVSGIPPGSTLTLPTTSCSPNPDCYINNEFPNEFLIKTSGATPTGNYIIVIKGVSAGLPDKTASFNLSIIPLQ